MATLEFLEFSIGDSHDIRVQRQPLAARNRQGAPDFVGIYVGGGGISGVLRAIRELPLERRNDIRIVCPDIGHEARKGLNEGLITAALCHPMEKISDELIDVMLSLVGRRETGSINSGSFRSRSSRRKAYGLEIV